MRLTTAAGAFLLAVSTVAVAQVGTTPEEQKVPTADDLAAPDRVMRPTPTPSATPTPEPGVPSAALVNSASTEPSDPVGQRPPK